jgi:hypothetical protein
LLLKLRSECRARDLVGGRRLHEVKLSIELPRIVELHGRGIFRWEQDCKEQRRLLEAEVIVRFYRDLAVGQEFPIDVLITDRIGFDIVTIKGRF